MSSGWVDLHAHYLPKVDDGVRTAAAGIALCKGLAQLGYAQVVTTPHMRTALYDNEKPGLEVAFANFERACADEAGMPQLGLAAEHFYDDVFWGRFEGGLILPYPGGHAALVELPESQLPVGLAQRFFHMSVRGVTPVLAHPERYRPLFRTTEPLEALLNMGLIAQLDLMSLVGRYGRAPRKAAERMLEEDIYFIACSDAHRPDDVRLVAEAIERLQSLVGKRQCQRLLAENPRRVLDGDLEAL